MGILLKCEEGMKYSSLVTSSHPYTDPLTPLHNTGRSIRDFRECSPPTFAQNSRGSIPLQRMQPAEFCAKIRSYVTRRSEVCCVLRVPPRAVHATRSMSCSC